MTNSVDTAGLRRARTLWKALEIGAVVVAAVLWFTYSFLRTHYDSTRPRIPDPGAGRIYRLNTHGSIVYLTRGEEFLLNVLLLTSGVCFVAAVCVDILRSPWRQGSDQRARSAMSSIAPTPSACGLPCATSRVTSPSKLSRKART